MPDAGGNIIITHNTFFMLLAVKHVFVKAQEKMKLFFSPNITEFIPFLGASTLYLRNGIKTSIYTQLRCRHTDKKKERCTTIVK